MIKICSLFAGIGGIDIGFQQAGFSTIWANEFDNDACRTFKQNFPDVKLVQEDITKVNVNDIPTFDVLVGGFPCQPFSVCGKQKGFDDVRGTLFFDICRILEAKKPQALFLENVANLVKHDNGNTFKVILSELDKLGYYVKYLVADACNYGLPQHRTRTYIVGFLDKGKCDKFSFPEEILFKPKIVDTIDFSIKAADELYFQPGTYKFDKLDKVIDDSEQIYRFSDYGIQKGKDGISFTLKANMGVWYDREPIIKDKFGIRRLSPKECLILQGFPINFTVEGIPVKSAYKQAGNTVCVPMVKRIADRMHSVMTGEEGLDQLVIVGTLKNAGQLKVNLKNYFYHIPQRVLKENPEDVKYIALHESKSANSEKYGIHHYGKVVNYQLVKRFDIKELPKNSDELYYRFEIDRWCDCDKQIAPQRFYGYYKCSLMDIIQF